MDIFPGEITPVPADCIEELAFIPEVDNATHAIRSGLTEDEAAQRAQDND